MDKQKIISDLQEMNTDDLINELTEARRRTVDFINYQQQMYIELQNKAVEIRENPQPVKEPEPEPEPEAEPQVEEKS